MEILHRKEEHSDDEIEADFDGHEDFEVGREGQPLLRKVLRLLSLMSTRWNSTSYLIKRALTLKDLLVMFTNSERDRIGEYPRNDPRH